jgi:hypothetical protein
LPEKRRSATRAFTGAAANLYQENIALKKKLGNSRRLASVPAQR